MADGLIDFMTQVRTVLATVSGLSWVSSSFATGASANWPAATIYAATGRASIGPPELMTTYDDITIAVLTPFEPFDKRVAQLLPFRESVPLALFAALRAGTFTAAKNFTTIESFFGEIELGGQSWLALTFTLKDRKEQHSLT